jgi:hypothetical protein
LAKALVILHFHEMISHHSMRVLALALCHSLN